jgi:hypothetical protein
MAEVSSVKDRLCSFFTDSSADCESDPLSLLWLPGDSLAPFVVTPSSNVFAALSLACVTSSDRLIDVGCGDCRVVVAAAVLTGAKAHGVELEPRALLAAQRSLESWREDTCGRASVSQTDATRPGALDGYSVIFCSLLPDGLAVLSDALQTARRNGARLLCLHFPLSGELYEARDEEHRLFLYPALTAAPSESVD